MRSDRLSLATLIGFMALSQFVPAARGQETLPGYVPRTLFDGTLYIGTADELSERQKTLLRREFIRAADTLTVLGAKSEAAASPALSVLNSIEWQNDVTYHATLSVITLSLREELSVALRDVKDGSCIWLSAANLPAVADDRTWLLQQLQRCLQRGGMVCIEDASAVALDKDKSLWQQIGATKAELLPDIQLVRERHPVRSGEEHSALDSLQLTIADDAWLRISDRELVNLSEPAAEPCQLIWPATASYPEQRSEPLLPQTMCDLVAARRASLERQQTAFPSETPYVHRLQSGSLVIVGGGGASREIWQKFIELAGGEEAHVIVLPTAVPNPESEPAEVRLLKRMGVEHIRVLPQIEHDEVASPEYLENFKWATAIWFGGGRQWRFVDAYWGTPAWSEIRKVIERGGVIGGSSAGATIQGDLLVRGHPLGNHIMVADGYRRGLGLLPGVAIDQHFRQRNRFDELASVVERFPQILGIGIDEGTALVVQAPDRCSVLGEGSVWLSYPSAPGGQRNYVRQPSGTEFELLGKQSAGAAQPSEEDITAKPSEESD